MATPGGRVQARARVRDFDGRYRLVSRTGASRAAAERALRAELSTRQPGAAVGGGVTRATRVAELAEVWLDGRHEWATGTRRTYRSVVARQIGPALGELRVGEVSAGTVSRALSAAAATSGPGIARTMRACLSGMFAVAVEDGALAANPVRASAARIGAPRRRARALTREEQRRLRELLRGSARAVELDLVGLVEFMLGTGARIGEALAARYGVNRDGRALLDLAAGTWEVDATVVRVTGLGLQLQPRPKTATGWRVVAPPASLTGLLAARARPSGAGLVFGAPVGGGLRDPNNVSGDLRQLLDGFDCAACAGTGYRPAAAGSPRPGGAGRGSAAMPGRGRGSPRTPSARRWRPGWRRRGSPRARSPIISGTPTRR